MPGTVLLRALGLSSNDEIIDVFGERFTDDIPEATDHKSDGEEYIGQRIDHRGVQYTQLKVLNLPEGLG